MLCLTWGQHSEWTESHHHWTDLHDVLWQRLCMYTVTHVWPEYIPTKHVQQLYFAFKRGMNFAKVKCLYLLCVNHFWVILSGQCNSWKLLSPTFCPHSERCFFFVCLDCAADASRPTVSPSNNGPLWKMKLGSHSHLAEGVLCSGAYGQMRCCCGQYVSDIMIMKD